MPDWNIPRLRLANLGLSAGAFKTPEAVVAHLGALQGQDYLASLWAVGSRLPGCTQAQVEAALTRRALVRSWPLRGTLHLVAAQDLGWMLALLGERNLARAAGRLRQLELDPQTLDRAMGLMAKALRQGPLSRPALLQALEHGGVSTQGQRGYHLLWVAAQRGWICGVGRLGKQDAFALSGSALPQTKARPRDAALAELAHRYFVGHGPATEDDFAFWAGLPLKEARLGLELARAGLQSREQHGRTYWMGARVLGPERDWTRPRLAAGFDECLLGYRDRGDVLEAVHAPKVCPGGNGVFLPLLLRQGQVQGAWTRELRAATVRVKVLPFRPWPSSQTRTLRAEAQAYAGYLGLSLHPDPL
ncbi:MAG TPA: winged helix DNA-binding domain-containing protein [bacterium]|jgi:hypothetical protein|nr:winged helix DNA-binding domain-containing protein [bacterium]